MSEELRFGRVFVTVGSTQFDQLIFAVHQQSFLEVSSYVFISVSLLLLKDSALSRSTRTENTGSLVASCSRCYVTLSGL
jgi:hypothetical protein